MICWQGQGLPLGEGPHTPALLAFPAAHVVTYFKAKLQPTAPLPVLGTSFAINWNPRNHHLTSCVIPSSAQCMQYPNTNAGYSNLKSFPEVLFTANFTTKSCICELFCSRISLKTGLRLSTATIWMDIKKQEYSLAIERTILVSVLLQNCHTVISGSLTWHFKVP